VLWVIAFVVKVAAGCFYGYWYSLPKNIIGADTWRFHTDALEQYIILKKNPFEFFRTIFGFVITEEGTLFTPYGFWNDLKDHLLIKIIALLNIFSGGYYYVNVLLYTLICFFGLFFLYNCFKNITGNKPSFLIWAAIVFAPSCLFWTSGLHKDGLMMLCTTFILYQLSKPPGKHMLLLPVFLKISASYVLLFLLKNYVAVLLLPLMLTWLISRLTSFNAHKLLAIIYGLGVIVFCLVQQIAGTLVQRKLSFEQLQGSSRLPVVAISTNPVSFILQLPKALNHALLRPYIWQAQNFMQLVAAVENIVLVTSIFIICFCWQKTQQASQTWLITGILAFAFSNILLLGYIVPFTGAMVRYKAFFEMLVLTTSVYFLNRYRYKIKK
jgi:hypothetical protein